MEAAGATRALVLFDPDCGLKAILAIDDMTLGPATGGIRTFCYRSDVEALAEARRLAAAMTVKCSIAGLDAGGGKMVVLDHPGLDRPRAFRRLGRFIEELGGRYWSAGDVGTTIEDLEAASETTRYINLGGRQLGLAVGRTVLNGIRACANARGRSVAGLSVAIQGCGLIGEGVARVLAREKMSLYLADVRHSHVQIIAHELGATVLPADDILLADVDIISPCAHGGSITRDLLERMKAWAICGGANNQLAGPEVSQALAGSNILYVPDFLASSGAVIVGIAGPLMGADKEILIAQTYETARRILNEAAGRAVATDVIGLEFARRRLVDRAAT